MKSAVLLIVHSLVLIVKALRPGGVKAIIAENVLLRHQLAILSRSRQKAPNLHTSDRFLFGTLSLLISPRRLFTVAIIIKPATLLKFHRALVKRKYRRLFSNKGHRRPGPKGPSRELVAAIVELKQRNPRYGCPRIAYIITLTFGIEINKDIVRRILSLGQETRKGLHGYRFLVTVKTAFGALTCFAVNPQRSSPIGSWSSWISGLAGSLVSGYIKDLSMEQPCAKCLTR